MENVADALKMASAAIIFVLAFASAMFLFSQARAATDVMFYSMDKTNLYSHIKPTENNVTREVGIETIIPTIYSYFQENQNNLQVKILDNHDNELQVFDTNIETEVRNLPAQKLDERQEYLKGKYDDATKPAYMYGAGWTSVEQRLKRINAYIYGKDAKINESLEVKYKSKDNYLMKYAGDTFEESYLEYQTDGQVLTDDGGDSLVVIEPTYKTVITYKLKEEPKE